MRTSLARTAAVTSTLLAAVAVLVADHASAAPDAKGASPRAREIPPPAVRSPEVSSAVEKANLPAKARDALLADYDKLPQEARALADAALGASKQGTGMSWLPIPPVNIAALANALEAAKPKVNNVFPEKAAVGDYAVVLGENLKGGTLRFDGVALPTMPFGSALVFQVPSGHAPGTTHSVTVVKGGFPSSNADTLKVVAPLGYRGRWGFQFSNFSTPIMPWSVFRDYFTASAVEYPNGTHRPAAQAWFDSTYRYVGNGGDCFGMSIRSIRARLWDWSGIASSWWPGNKKDFVWDYPFVTQVADSVREDQGGQLAAQAAALITNRYNNQTANQAWSFVRAAHESGSVNRTALLGMWSSNAGHAVVAYDTTESGNTRTIKVYDNNKPYAENEANDQNSTATINKVSATFSYGGYSRVAAFEFRELVFNPPLLPTAAGGPAQNGLGANVTIVVGESQAAIKQITDVQGRKFFASDGQINMDPATRIPNSMRYVPLTGNSVPADFPGIYIFTDVGGKSLSVDVDQATAAPVRVFNRGRLLAVHARTGKIEVGNILLPEQGLLLENPAGMGVSKVEFIAITPDGSERVSTLTLPALSSVLKGNVLVRPSPSDSGFTVENGLGQALNLNVDVRGYSASGVQQRSSGLNVPGGHEGVFTVPNFANLQGIPPTTRSAPLKASPKRGTP
jgi:hypothetical protein